MSLSRFSLTGAIGIASVMLVLSIQLNVELIRGPQAPGGLWLGRSESGGEYKLSDPRLYPGGERAHVDFLRWAGGEGFCASDCVFRAKSPNRNWICGFLGVNRSDGDFVYRRYRYIAPKRGSDGLLWEVFTRLPELREAGLSAR